MDGRLAAAAALLLVSGYAGAAAVARPAAVGAGGTTSPTTTVSAVVTTSTAATSTAPQSPSGHTTVTVASPRTIAVPPSRVDPHRPRPAPIEAAFEHESYAPGSTAAVRVFRADRDAHLQLFRVGPERADVQVDDELRGVAASGARRVALRAGALVRVRVGRTWPSGVYFARFRAGRAEAFAPFVVRPRRLGERRVAVVMPTTTWQAYNRRDDDGDGVGDTWYADRATDTARLARPFLHRGVPLNFRLYDLPFLRWLDVERHRVDVLTDADLDTVHSGVQLAHAYDLIVFPGHHEYVTTHEYDLVERYRDLGGHLMFLSANNFFWQVTRKEGIVERIRRWRALGRPEAALVGVQYRANDHGEHRGSWRVRDVPSAEWAFRGSGLAPGGELGRGGIEIDHTAAASPPRTQVLAEIPNLFGRGRTAQMTYYETAAGARVFAAGAFGLVHLPLRPEVGRLLENLWDRLASKGS